MKKLLILFFICIVQNTFSQKTDLKVCKPSKTHVESTDKNENTIYNPLDIETKPEFPGGRVKFNHFLDDNYKNQTKDQPYKENYLQLSLLKKMDH